MRTLSRFRRPDHFYHVILRASRREPLFTTPADRRALNHISISVLKKFDACLHAYCLLPNQFRVLVQINSKLIGKALRRIAVQYSRHRYGNSESAAYVFERPYKAHRIDTAADFLSQLRSIHLSPVIANKVVAPADYKWSSHRAYLGYKSVAWITTDFGLSLLASDRTQARVAYHQFITEGMSMDVQASSAVPMGTAMDTSKSTELMTERVLKEESQARHGAALFSLNRQLLLDPNRATRLRSSRRYLSIY